MNVSASSAPSAARTAQAVLTSGGLDSAILVAHLARAGSPVVPIYVRSGLAWEAVEIDYLRVFLQQITPRFPQLQPLVFLDQSCRDLYGHHWSLSGQHVPDEKTPDEAVYLPGRNLLLTVKALVWCHLHGIKTLALGVLGSNPFPDATEDFFTAAARAVGLAVNDAGMRIERPFGSLHKVDVMRLGRDLPLEWSFSCINPVSARHCGRCNKCAERKLAFRSAGLTDPTLYTET